MQFHRALWGAGLFAAALLVGAPAWGEDSSAVIVSHATAQSHGLKRAWLTHVEISPGQDRIQAVVYWGPSAPPPAPKKAAEPAEVIGKKEPMEVEDLLPKPPPPPVVVPIEQRNTVFVLSRRGVLHALDAETGRTFWVTQVGSREKPCEPPGVGKLYVAVINGSDLYVLDRRDGGVAFRKTLHSVPSAAPAVGDQWVYVPMLSGNVVAYKLPDVRLGAGAPPPALAAAAPKAAPAPKAKNLEERDKKLREMQREDYASGQIPTMTYTSFAPINVPPLVAGSHVAWATARGQIYLAFTDRPEIDNRLNTLRPIEAPLTAWPPYIYAASKDGYVYGINELKRGTPWRYSIGEPLYEPAVAVEDAVYAIGPNSGMYCLDAKTGDRRWWAPGIRRCLAVGANRIYTADNSGALQVLDRKSGAQLDSLRIDRLDLRVVNWRSDRIYLGTEGGVLQCLHEIGQDKPLMHYPLAPRPTMSAADAKVVAELEKKVPVDFVETPLSDVAAFLKDALRVNVRIDQPALDKAGVTDKTPVSHSAKDKPLKEGLEAILNGLGLAYVIENGELVITSSEVADAKAKR